MFKAYGNFWKQYFDFKGRTSRKGYWWVVLANALISLFFYVCLLMAMGQMLASNVDATPGGKFPGMIICMLSILGLIGLYHLAIIIPSLAISVRRYRDAGLNPWWVWLLPLSGLAIVAAAMTQTFSTQLGSLLLAFYIVSVVMSLANLVICALPSDYIVKNK
ncbi:DUF805 domain-containing protein [Eupransor demetentiae]|uniref:DUF805 family (YhaH) n=1 Tax=Eupransor demetentiae TaxID=3109584 RepID=A0ABM9N693_9LACO|nr:DUF805 family (yhaH) [Lactobacillaceae bacterium LMG 33000]